MATQIFLHLEIAGRQINGEATAGGYEGDIEVESFRFGAEAEYPPRVDRTKVKPRIKYKTLTISKLYDKSSINMSRYMGLRTPFDHAQLVVDHHAQHAGQKKDQNPAFVYDLNDGFIDSVKLTISESDKGASVKEDVVLSFQRLDVYYYPPTADDRVKRGAAVIFNGPRIAKR